MNSALTGSEGHLVASSLADPDAEGIEFVGDGRDDPDLVASAVGQRADHARLVEARDRGVDAGGCAASALFGNFCGTTR